MGLLPWIKVHTDLPDHPKSIALADATGIKLAWAHVELVWFWAARNRPDGDLSGMSDEAIGQRAGIARKPAEFAKAMRAVGFLDQDNRLHNWNLEQGAHVRARDADRAKKEKKRDKIRTSRGTEPGTSPGTEGDFPSKSKTRELRTEIEELSKQVPSPAPPDGAAPAGDTRPVQPSLLSVIPGEGIKPEAVPKSKGPSRKRSPKPDEPAAEPGWLATCTRVHEYAKHRMGAPMMEFSGREAKVLRSALDKLKTVEAVEALIVRLALDEWCRKQPLWWLLSPDGIDRGTRASGPPGPRAVSVNAPYADQIQRDREALGLTRGATNAG